jgi:hypothetical protein
MLIKNAKDNNHPFSIEERKNGLPRQLLIVIKELKMELQNG